jgi:anti-sigma regulatory factor (Ser/Thr protein kinase)
MWNIVSSDKIIVKLPKQFNSDTMYPFIATAIDEQCDASCTEITFDFEDLQFIEPVGVVVLSNLVEYLLKLGVRTGFTGLTFPSNGVIYLDDSGFFAQYIGKPLRVHAVSRETTLPLRLVANPQAIGYLYQTMVPWIAQRLKTTAIALATVRVCLEEIFHNISDHSGVDVGCVHAQHFPKLKQIEIAISDFGLGIPNNVWKVRPGISSSDALALAIQEGFTTKSNVRNRGAGLAVLMKYVTLRNKGVVLITSGKGNVSAVERGGQLKITARERPSLYPGTLIRVILNTDSLQDLFEDIEHEEFSW